MVNNSHTDPLKNLDNNEIKSRLLATSIILSAYEIVKNMIVSRTKLMFLVGFGYGGYEYSDKYNTEVLSRHESALIASAKYLAEYYEAISVNDVDKIISLRNLRNSIAHDLPTVLVNYNFSKLKNVVDTARDLVFKLDNFWLYIEIGHDREHADTDWDSAYSNATMFIDTLENLLNDLCPVSG